jgi:anti-sigma factor RsiW
MRNEALDKMLSAYLDGELTQADEQRVRIYLEDNEEARKEFEELQALKKITSSLSFPPPPDERMDELARALSVQAPQRAGWFLLSIGVVAVTLVVITKLALTPDIPLFAKAVYGTIGGGFLLLLVSVARQRWLEAPYDRYRGVKR